jgi:hypothetical protein
MYILYIYLNKNLIERNYIGFNRIFCYFIADS